MFKQAGGGALVLLAIVCASSLAHAQIGRTFDWYTAAGDQQRSGFEKSDTKFTKEGVKDFKLVLKHQFIGANKKAGELTAPVVLGTLISYKGFKELGFVANNMGDVWALDLDLDRVFWQRNLDLPKAKSKAGCPAGVSSTPTMEPGVAFGARRRTGAAAPSQQAMFRRIFAPRTVYLMAGNGSLYRLDTSTGKDMNPPLQLMPAGGYASNLNAAESAIYTTTGNSCNGVPNALWLADFSGEKPNVTSFPATAPEGFVGRGGPLVGEAGNVYVQTSNTLQSISPKDLKVQQTFSAALGRTSPVAFTYKEHDAIVASGKNGSLYLLDSKSMTVPLFQTPAVAANEEKGIAGLATWEAGDGTRWLLAAVSGPLHGDLKMEKSNPNGSIVAFKLTEAEGKPVLSPAWVSEDLSLPQTPVIANGLVFALSAGTAGKKGKVGGHATLYALDGETGKQMYSTGDQVSTPASMTGLTIANGRVMFSTADNTLYGFGYTLEH